MKIYELLEVMRSGLESMAANGIEARDIRYLDMFREYIRLKGEGHKYIYIVHYLSQQYDVSEVTVYRVVKKFNKSME